MTLDEYLMSELNVDKEDANKIIDTVHNYKKNKKKNKKKLNILIPYYTLGEEIVNAISHGLGAIFAIVALVLMAVKAEGTLAETTSVLFGCTMILLYTVSCIYHALSPNIEGKKVMRVIDHCNVYLLVYGTYIPISLLGVGGTKGLILFLIVTAVTTFGIVLTSVKIDKTETLQTICHLISGWSVLFVISDLSKTLGAIGLVFLILGGVMYTVGSILYALGEKKRYMHSVFHFFCIFGTVFHFLCVYVCLL